MRLYFEIARRGYRRYAAYPWATAAGVFTNVIFAFMRGYILLALFDARDEIAGYDATQALTFVWVTQALIVPVYMWSWVEVALRVRSGDIATDLYRPVDPQAYWLAEDLGRALYHVVFRGLPPFLVGALVFELAFPDDALTWAAFALSVLLAVVVGFGFRFLSNLATFWIVDYRGIAILATLVATFCSGLLVPVRFLPGWLEAVVSVLPFVAMLQIPADVFLGELTGAELAGALGFQAFWAAALLLSGRAVFAAGTRKLVVQGG
jgi:viologen exporter family transport system permease protein